VEKGKARIQFASSGNSAEAKHGARARADPSCRGVANDSGDRGEKGRAQPEHCLDATNSKAGDSARTSDCCVRICARGAVGRKESPTEKAAAPCCATGGGDHSGARSDVAVGCPIDGNQRALARVLVRSETPPAHRKRYLRRDR